MRCCDYLCYGYIHPILAGEDWDIPVGIKNSKLYARRTDADLPDVTVEDNGKVCTVFENEDEEKVWIADIRLPNKNNSARVLINNLKTKQETQKTKLTALEAII